MVSLPPRESSVWSDTGVAYAPGEEVYVAGEQPIAEIDNRAMYEVTTDIETLFNSYNGHLHDDRYYTESEADSRFASGSHTHDDRYFTEAEANNRYSQLGHTHDDRYYTETQADNRYSQLGHNHDGSYYTKSQSDTQFADAGHLHDDRYYTESEANNRFVNAGGDSLTGNLRFIEQDRLEWSLPWWNGSDNFHVEAVGGTGNEELEFRWSTSQGMYDVFRLRGTDPVEFPFGFKVPTRDNPPSNPEPGEEYLIT